MEKVTVGSMANSQVRPFVVSDLQVLGEAEGRAYGFLDLAVDSLEPVRVACCCEHC